MRLFWLLPFVFTVAVSCKNGKQNGAIKLPPTLVDTSFIVLLDAGHGGKDGGAYDTIKTHTNRRILEKNIVFQIVNQIKQQCLKENIKVYLTRETDTFLFLKTRLTIEKNVRPNLFISLHVNEFAEDSSIRGAEFYAVNKNNPYYKESIELGNMLQKNFTALNFMKVRGWKKLPSRLFLLHNSICPAILTELGYIFNKEDYEMLTDKNRQQEIANAITSTIKNFKNADTNTNMRLQARIPLDKKMRTIKITQHMGDYAVVVVNGVEYNSELLTEIDTTKIFNVSVRPPVANDFVKYGFIARDSIVTITLHNADSPFIFKTEMQKQRFWQLKTVR